MTTQEYRTRDGKKFDSWDDMVAYQQANKLTLEHIAETRKAYKEACHHARVVRRVANGWVTTGYMSEYKEMVIEETMRYIFTHPSIDIQKFITISTDYKRYKDNDEVVQCTRWVKRSTIMERNKWLSRKYIGYFKEKPLPSLEYDPTVAMWALVIADKRIRYVGEKITLPEPLKEWLNKGHSEGKDMLGGRYSK